MTVSLVGKVFTVVFSVVRVTKGVGFLVISGIFLSEIKTKFLIHLSNLCTMYILFFITMFVKN